jgi:DNA polymerase-1
MWTIDFETEAIGPRPAEYPPKPVGLGLKHYDKPGYYLSWGHPEENNTTEEKAREALARIYASGEPLLFHNCKFDLEVAEAHWDLPIPHWEQVHDTQFLLYLENPHARALGLKPSAERLLDWPPEERDALRDWILAHVKEAKKSTVGAYIARAPGELVGTYCIGDVDRTYALYQHLAPYIEREGMWEAYVRERKLMPVLLEMEKRGMRVDVARLEEDLEVAERSFALVGERLQDMLGDINYNSGDQLAAALLSKGYATSLPRTPTGRYSTSQDALASHVEHPTLLPMLAYRGALKTLLSTFMRPWMAQAKAANGRLNTTWHQTRGATDKGGTRTGRLSSSGPNLTNVPNPFDREMPEGCTPIPMMREYLLPEEGHVWLKRDYSSQEVRTLAHFEDGALLKQYLSNPDLDPHQFAADLIEELTGNTLDRGYTKRIAFSILYGSGITSLSADLNVGYEDGKRFKELYLAAFPDVRELISDVKRSGRKGEPVRTLGGRLIYAEVGADGRDFSYKLLNHLIQGSAADMTKEGLIQYADVKSSDVLITAAVHDEVNASVPEELAKSESEVLREAMCDATGAALNFDCPITTELYAGVNWEDADQHKGVKL